MQSSQKLSERFRDEEHKVLKEPLPRRRRRANQLREGRRTGIRLMQRRGREGGAAAPFLAAQHSAATMAASAALLQWCWSKNATAT